MPPKEKIYFTADLVAKFGKEEYSTKLASVPVVLATVVEQLVTRFPSIDLGKVQSFATDLVISDYLKSEAGSEEKLVKFVQVGGGDMLGLFAVVLLLFCCCFPLVPLLPINIVYIPYKYTPYILFQSTSTS